MLALSRVETPTETIARFTESAPVDVYGLAKALGLDVIEEPMPDGASGSIHRDWFSGAYIVAVNSGHPRNRRRFTLAHEIAHYALHRDRIGDGINDDKLYRSGLPDALERQANQYAATILMPAPLVRQAYAQGKTTPVELAAIFQVSPAVAEIRIKELRLA